jgi:hypothetical protein
MSVTPEDSSEQFSIGLGQARETLKRTTQRIVRLAVMPLARRYCADQILRSADCAVNGSLTLWMVV